MRAWAARSVKRLRFHGTRPNPQTSRGLNTSRRLREHRSERSEAIEQSEDSYQRSKVTSGLTRLREQPGQLIALLFA